MLVLFGHSNAEVLYCMPDAPWTIGLCSNFSETCDSVFKAVAKMTKNYKIGEQQESAFDILLC